MRVFSALKTATAVLVMGQTAQSVAVSSTRAVAVQRNEILQGRHIHLKSRDSTAIRQLNPQSDLDFTSQTAGTLQIEIANDRSVPINAYIGGRQKVVVDNKPETQQVMLQVDTGTYYPLKNVGGTDPNKYTPVPSNIPLAIYIPANSAKTVTLPDYLLSGRIWIAEGELEFRAYPGGIFSEPSGANPDLPEYNVKWGFVELNHDTGGLIINLSFVDWVSLSLGMSLTSEGSDGNNNITNVGGLEPGAMQNICDGLKNQTNWEKDNARPYDWDKLCIYSTSDNSTLLRVISPNIALSINRATTLENYYLDYVNRAWKQYTNQSLTLNLQGDEAGNPLSIPGSGVATVCQVGSGTHNLTCDKAPNHTYAKPTTAQIWACAGGPFDVGDDRNGTDPYFLMHSRIIPRLCAAFTRSTLFLANGNVQPFGDETQYYTANVTNHYSRIVHDYLVDGRGYSFPYDDVNPDGVEHNAAGVLAADKPIKVHIDVKGDLSS